MWAITTKTKWLHYICMPALALLYLTPVVWFFGHPVFQYGTGLHGARRSCASPPAASETALNTFARWWHLLFSQGVVCLGSTSVLLANPRGWTQVSPAVLCQRLCAGRAPWLQRWARFPLLVLSALAQGQPHELSPEQIKLDFGENASVGSCFQSDHSKGWALSRNP